jgi:hypothetical protein
MPVKTFGNLTLKMFKTMEGYDTNTIDVLDLFERLTLDAIGLAGFGMDTVYLQVFILIVTI